MADKLKTMIWTPGDGHAPQLSDAIAVRIKQNLLDAAFTAIWEGDIVARDVPGSHLLNNQNLCTQYC